VREWIARLISVRRRGGRDKQLDDELRFHLEELASAFERRGLDPAAARAAAERELGGLDRTKQAWRDQRSWLWLEDVLQDIAYGVRVLRRSRSLTTLAAMMLAIAVAATTSLFTVVDAVLLAPLPYGRADQLVVVFEDFLTQHAPNVSVTPGTLLEWQDRTHSFSAFTAIDQRQQNLTADGEPQQVNVGAVSSGFGETIRVQPVSGRVFTDEEFQPGHDSVALIGHALWTTRYGRAPMLGRTIRLDDRAYTVVGVMPSGFMFPTAQPQIWVPMPLTAGDRENRTGHALFAVARVRDGIAVATADRELHEVAATLRREFPEKKEWGVTVTPAREAIVGKTTGVLRAMVGAVALLIVVACANVAGLLLTHGVARGRELAVRMAMGANRMRIVRQLLTESVLLAVIGALSGVALAWFAQPLVDRLRPADLITWKPIALDVPALACAAGVAIVCGALFGTFPALIASRASIGATASERAAGVRASRVRQALVAVEVALAVVLVVGAALLSKTLSHMTAVEPGFRPDSVVSMTVALPVARYADDRRVDLFYRALAERLRSIPGVRAAGATHALPLSGNSSVRPYRVEGTPPRDPPTIAHYRIVVPGYIEAMRIPLRAGRTFTDADTGGRPLVVIVNETLRREGWGARNPVGTRITFAGMYAPPHERWAEVVGVVADVRHFGPGTPPPPEMYWPAEQIDAVPGEALRRMRRGLTLVISTEAGDPLTIVPSVRAAVRAVDPDQPIAEVRTMTSLMGASLWLSRAAAWLLAVFGGAAVTFALLGVFGAASYSVAQRRRELAVRLALGAEPTRVMRLVLTGTLRGAMLGIGVGLVLAVALRQCVSSMVVGIDPSDPPTLALVCASLAFATVVACWFPARRASRIDPMQALRDAD
jgi:putative ABC transport system permease protein